MHTTAKRAYVATHLIALLAFAVAAFLVITAPRWISSDAGAWVVGIIAFVFVATLLVLTAIASFGDNVLNNSFSRLLRDSTVNTTFYPWALAAYMGRWFHPADGLNAPLGAWGPIVLMGATWGVIVLGDVLKGRATRIPPWLVVAVGFAVGTVTWPA